jgi:hypothetical protein
MDPIDVIRAGAENQGKERNASPQLCTFAGMMPWGAAIQSDLMVL